MSTQRAFPVTERRIWTNIHTASATISGGHTQFNAVSVWLPGLKTTRATSGGAHGDRRDDRPPLRLPGAAHGQDGHQRPAEPEPEQQGPGDGGLGAAGEHDEGEHQRGDGAGDDGGDDGAPGGAALRRCPGRLGRACCGRLVGWVWTLIVVSFSGG